jgi:nitronate monooxygenase
VLRNQYTDMWHGRDADVTAQRDWLNVQIEQAREDGNQEIIAARAGNAAGLIQTIEPAGEIVRNIMAEAEHILRDRPGQVLAAE